LNKREVEKSDVAEILQELSAGLNQGWSNDKKKRVKRSLIRRRREAKGKYIFYNFKIMLSSLYILCLSGCLSVCLFVSNKRQNG